MTEGNYRFDENNMLTAGHASRATCCFDSLFLNSGMRDGGMQNTEYTDCNWQKCTLHVQPKPWRHFRLKDKKKKKSAKDRFIPIPAKLVSKTKDRMPERNAQPHDLVFANGNGKPDGHCLRKLKAMAKKAGIEGPELHRFRKTYAALQPIACLDRAGYTLGARQERLAGFTRMSIICDNKRNRGVTSSGRAKIEIRRLRVNW